MSNLRDPMSDYSEKIRELHAQATWLPYGEAKLALYEEAVRIADTHGDDELAYQMRDQLIDAATHGGYPEKALVAYSWCLAQSDRNADWRATDFYFEHSLLWKYKWIIDILPGFPQISRQQIYDMFADMEQRFASTGVGLRVAKKLECNLAFEMGERDKAASLLSQWQEIPRDSMSDCRACEQDDVVWHHSERGEHTQAVSAAQMILNGKLSCAEVPHRTYARVLSPLFHLGELPEAVDIHQKGYRMIASNAAFLRHWASHLEFLVLTDNLSRGCKLFEHHLEKAHNSTNRLWALEFVTAGLLLMKQMNAKGQSSCSMRLPKDAALFREDGAYQTNELIQWLEETANDIAKRLDRRNGNDWYSQWIRRSDTLLDQVKPYELR